MTSKPVGIFGGVFNPVHNGHTALARAAVAKLNLDALIVIPCADPPHKPMPAVSALDRLEMTRLAFEGIDKCIVSSMEIERKGASYTIDTIREVSARYSCRPILLIGADNINELQQWKDPGSIISESNVVAFTRPGFTQRNNANNSFYGKILFLEMDPVPFSSTDIRNRIAEDLPIANMVPPTVAKFIEEYRLYR